jgi:NitT/TauT family transport system substrate-binding protein
VALFAIALLAAACGDDDDTSSGDSGEDDGGSNRVRFLKSNRWDAGTGGAFFSAVEEGFFEDEGLDVEAIETLGSATGVAALVSGSAEIAQTTPDALMNGIGQGADLVAIWNWLDIGVFGTLVNTSAGIDSIEDLEGKTIGIINRSSATLFSTQVQLASVGLTEEDINEFVALSCCSAQYTELLAGSVDAIGTWDGQYLTIQQTAAAEGEDEWLGQTEMFWSEDYLGDILITTRSYLEENRDNVIGFLKAMQAGEQFEVDNPQAALENAATHIDTVDPADPSQLEQLELRAGTWKLDGEFDLEQVEKSLGLYFDVALTNVSPAAIDLNRIFLNDVVAEVNEG